MVGLHHICKRLCISVDRSVWSGTVQSSHRGEKTTGCVGIPENDTAPGHSRYFPAEATPARLREEAHSHEPGRPDPFSLGRLPASPVIDDDGMPAFTAMRDYQPPVCSITWHM